MYGKFKNNLTIIVYLLFYNVSATQRRKNTTSSRVSCLDYHANAFSLFVRVEQSAFTFFLLSFIYNVSELKHKYVNKLLF